MPGRKKPMGDQSVPQWGLRPWMDIASDDDPTFEFVAGHEPSRHKPWCRIVTHPDDDTCNCGVIAEEGV